jgi:predicted nucleic acid-binding protein
MVLIDTSVWSLALRREDSRLDNKQRKLRNALSQLVSFHNAKIIGPIRQEVLSGIRHRAQFLRIRGQLSPFADETLGSGDFEVAAELCNECLGRGIAGSNVDFLICAVSIGRSWSIFTTDNDFERYAKVLPIKLFSPST